MPARIIQSLQSRPALLKIAFFSCLAAAALADLCIARHEPYFWGDRLPLFWSIFGLGCCILMAVVCKWISKKLLARDENYYEK